MKVLKAAADISVLQKHQMVCDQADEWRPMAVNWCIIDVSVTLIKLSIFYTCKLPLC